jgi:hypothetical protein
MRKKASISPTSHATWATPPPTTTAGYVRHLGLRPIITTQAASRLLDPLLDD